MRKLLTRYLPAFAAALCLLAAGTMPLAAEEGYTEDGQAVYDGAETADPGYVDPGYADPGTDGTGYDPSQDGTGMPEDAGTEYTDGTDLSGETPSDGQTEEGEEQDGGGEGTQPVFGDYETIEIYGSETDDEKAICRTRVIFTGDSRTVGMHHAVESEDFWFAKVGQGYAWMTETALDQVEESLRPNTDVVVLFGVNDLRNCTEYITCLNEKAKEWKTKGVRTYFVSVNPVRDGYAGEVTNSAISEFNARVKAEFTEGAYIDTYNAIIDTYVAPDGLHYDDATYQAIYSYIMDNIARADYSAVFDFDYYYGAYEDVAAEYAGDPNGAFLHFMGVGMQEGRQASEEFDMRSYQNEYADLRREFGTDNPSYYLHYVTKGKAEGRHGTGCDTMQDILTVYEGIDYAPVYDYYSYIGRYSYIRRRLEGDDAAVLEHFVKYGMAEARVANETFNVRAYRSENPLLHEEYGGDFPKYYLAYIQENS